MNFESVVRDLVPSTTPKSRNFGDNAIVHKKALIVGAMGKGKSKLMESMAEAAKEIRPEEFAGFIEKAGVRATLTQGVKAPAKTWFFGNDDLTLAEVSAQDVNNYYQIRHRISSATHRREGLSITAMGVHRFLGLDVNLGTEFDQLWVKSLPDRPHDRAILLNYFDHMARYRRRKGELCECNACVFERMGEPNNKALVRLSTGESHIIDVPYPSSNPLVELKDRRLSNGHIAMNVAIGTGLLIAVALTAWTLVRTWMRFA